MYYIAQADTIGYKLNLKLIGEPYNVGAHLTTFPASYKWMHDPETYVLEQDQTKLGYRPLYKSSQGSMKNGVLYSSERRWFDKRLIHDLWPVLNAVSTDRADCVYDLPVMKVFPAISDWI